MKGQRTVSLSEELLKRVSERARKEHSEPSELIEHAVVKYINRAEHEEMTAAQRADEHARQVALINQHAEELNAAMADVLQDQIPI